MELQPEHGQDQQRTFLVLLLMMGLFIIWSTVFLPRPTPREETPDQAEKQAAKEPGAAKKGKAETVGKAEPKPPGKAPPPKATTETPAAVTVPEEEPPAEEEPEPLPQKVVRRSKRFTAVFTNQDAALERLTLLDYYRDPPSKAAAQRALEANPQADVTEYGFPLLGQKGTEPSGVLAPRGEGAEEGAGQAASGPFESRRYEVLSGAEDAEVVFQARFGPLEVTKTFRLPAEDAPRQRHIHLEVRVRNVGETPVEYPGYRLHGARGIAVDVGPMSWKQGETVPDESERKSAARSMGAAVALRNESGQLNVARSSCSSLQDEPLSRSEAPVMWSGVQSDYFAVILDPLPGEGEESWVWSGGAGPVGEMNLSSHVETANAVLGPGESVVHQYRLYAGPKHRGELEAYGTGYEEIIDPSWLYYLKVVLYAVLRGGYAVVPNWGVAIIILTIFVRMILHPLSRKSQVSMAKMQKLQPQMKELREKFKKDKRRQQEELMKLYRSYGVNPVGGCLPMLLQIPVFIGLWGVLRESIELRHAPFVLWIRDLSQPDAFLGQVNVLPLLCVVVMFVQQRMMPKSPDPQQQQTQKIMGYMMPALLGFIFYGLASGVTLYFSASMFLGVVEQKVIRRHLDKMGDLKPVARKPDKQARKAVSARPPRKRKPF